MRKIAKILILLVLLILCFTVSACGNMYTSKYSATMMVKTNTSNKATISFGSFKGTYVMQLRNNSDDEVLISYDAKLESGSIKVYYDFNGEKLSLFEINSNGSLNSKTEPFKANKTIYIIIESDGKCNEGKFTFNLQKA